MNNSMKIFFIALLYIASVTPEEVSPSVTAEEVSLSVTAEEEVMEEEITDDGMVQCFTCNSQVDKICGDPFFVDSPAIRDEYLFNCTEKDGKKPFCRKIKMHFDVNGEVRVERGCGYEKRDGPDCYQRRSEDFVKDVCACTGSECNGALARGFVSLAVMLISMTVFLL